VPWPVARRAVPVLPRPHSCRQPLLRPASARSYELPIASTVFWIDYLVIILLFDTVDCQL